MAEIEGGHSRLWVCGEEAESGLALRVADQVARARLAFVHPLTRAAVYDQLGELRRTRLHAEAAGLMPDESQAIRHLVAATTGPDAELASQVETVAVRELGRGAMGLAASHLFASAQVSEGPREYERRTLLAADALLSAGDFSSARALEERMARFAPAPRRDSILGFLALTGGRGGRGVRCAGATIAFRSTMHASLSLDDGEVLDWTARSLTSTTAGAPEHGRALTLLALALAKVGRQREARDALDAARATMTSVARSASTAGG